MGVNTLPQDPLLERWQNELYGKRYGIGQAAKVARRYVKDLDAGKDVGEIGSLAPIREQAASEQRAIQEQAGVGANALIAQGGGENANILRRAQDQALNQSRERWGQNISSAANERYRDALSIWDQGVARRQALNQGNMMGALNNRLGYYGQRYQHKQGGGFLGALGGILGGVGQAAAGFGI